MRLHETMRRLFALSAVLILAGCAPAFSRQALERVDRSVTFAELQSNPERYRGKWVMLAGIVIKTRNTAEGSLVEVLQRPADRQGRPEETDATGGRFLISTLDFLDAAVYHEGKRLSVVGEVAGQKIEPLGEIRYRYPVILAKELHLWGPRTSPQFSFGIGIGVYH